MKRLFVLLCLLPTAGMANGTTWVAVSNTTPTAMPTTPATSRRALLIENRGENAIYCSYSSSVTTDTGHEVSASAGRRLEFPGDTPVYCIAETAAQTGTGSDRTIISEV